MVFLAAGAIRPNTGSFPENIDQEHKPNRTTLIISQTILD